MTGARDIITEAMAVAEAAAEGKLDAAALEAEAVEECRRLFSTVTPDGPHWVVQLDVARAVLAAGGIPAAELREWAAVAASNDSGVSSD